MEVAKFWTYNDEFKKKLSYRKCILKLHDIFRKYHQELFIKCIGHIGKGFMASNNKEMIKKVQKELFNIEAEQNIIHRAALSSLYQFVLEFKDFNKYDVSVVIKPRDLFVVFLLINEIFERFHDEFKQIRSKIESIYFYGVHLFHDIMTYVNVQATAYHMFNIYKKMIGDNNFNSEINYFNENHDYSFKEYINHINNLIIGNKNDSIFNIMINEYAFDIKDIISKWDNRKFKIQPPFDYKFLYDYPIIKINEEKYIVNFYYGIQSFLLKGYHSFSNRDKFPNFRQNLGRYIVEDIIKDFLRFKILNRDITELNMVSPDGEYADFGVICENKILLFEIKSGSIPVQVKFGRDIKKFFDIIDNKFIKKDGINQQVKRLKYIDNNFEQFCDNTNINYSKNYEIYPILVFTEEIFGVVGAMQYMRDKFTEYKITHGLNLKNYFLQSNSIITFTELYYLSKTTTLSKENRFNTLIKLSKQNMPLYDMLEDFE